MLAAKFMNFRAIYVQEVPKLTELTNEKKSRETKTRGTRHKQRRIRVLSVDRVKTTYRLKTNLLEWTCKCTLVL